MTNGSRRRLVGELLNHVSRHSPRPCPASAGALFDYHPDICTAVRNAHRALNVEDPGLSIHADIRCCGPSTPRDEHAPCEMGALRRSVRRLAPMCFVRRIHGVPAGITSCKTRAKSGQRSSSQLTSRPTLVRPSVSSRIRCNRAQTHLRHRRTEVRPREPTPDW